MVAEPTPRRLLLDGPKRWNKHHRENAAMFAKRDVFALLLSCFAVYYSTLSEGVVSFHPAFVVARDGVAGETAWASGEGPGGVFASGDVGDVDDPTDARRARARDDRPPPPQFFDLNGDGVREMLVAAGGGASGDEPTLRMVELDPSSREDVREKHAFGKKRKSRRRAVQKYSRATEDVLAAEPRAFGGAALFGSADAFERARVLARVSLAPREEADAETERRGDDGSKKRSDGSRTPVAVGVGGVRPAKNASSHFATSRDASSKPSRRRAHASPPRKGVVVVVTEGWHVVCFDHNLRVMWERALGGDFPRHAKPREAAVLVTAAALYEGDRGTVIVGGRIDRGVIDEEADVNGAFDPLNAELERERAVRARAGGEKTATPGDEKGENEFPTPRHFNYYAFETGTGEPRWVHESDDFHRDVRGLADALVPQHDHKLDAAAREASEGRHFGEAACREFRESMTSRATPHRWTGREDTRFALARFERHKRAVDRPGSLNGDGKPTPFREGGEDGRSEFFGAPNVLVAHQEEGVEVVHLFGGRTVCKMLLTPLDAHADVNGDGVLEHVSARGGGGARLTAAGESLYAEKGGEARRRSGDRACWARVSAGTPPRGVVFEGSICRGSMGVTRHERRDKNGNRNGVSRDDANAGGFISGNNVDVASPVALRRPAPRTKPKSSRAARRDAVAATSRSPPRGGASASSAVKELFDLVFLNSRGEMTSYTHEGTRRWQLRTDSGWARGGGATPGLVAFPLRAPVVARGDSVDVGDFANARVREPEVALAVGATRATFVTPSGYVLATLRLPARPIAPVLVEDVDGDGLNDVVLRTERGTFAWRQKSRVGAKPFSALAGALCLLVGGTLVAQMAHARATGMERLVRSTEMDDAEGRKDR